MYTSSWRRDAAIDRMRARARTIAALALIALMAGTVFAGSLSALMHPLIAAVAQLEAATARKPYSGSAVALGFKRPPARL